eukprot:scaffold537_cov241-Pinguiococcus_pyrenoidosus.AAC.13
MKLGLMLLLAALTLAAGFVVPPQRLNPARRSRERGAPTLVMMGRRAGAVVGLRGGSAERSAERADLQMHCRAEGQAGCFEGEGLRPHRQDDSGGREARRRRSRDQQGPAAGGSRASLQRGNGERWLNPDSVPEGSPRGERRRCAQGQR